VQGACHEGINFPSIRDVLHFAPQRPHPYYPNAISTSTSEPFSDSTYLTNTNANGSVQQWCLVLAGVSDFYRPAEKLSLTQNAALTATGLIWTRWCLIIKPRNIMYAFLPSPVPFLPMFSHFTYPSFPTPTTLPSMQILYCIF
jgi:hypothetical protein